MNRVQVSTLFLVCASMLGASSLQSAFSKNQNSTEAPTALSHDAYLEQLRKRFLDLDKDRNGYLDSNECSAIAAWCKIADKNKNSQVDLNEFNQKNERDFNRVDKNKNHFLENKEKNGLILFRF